MQPAITPGSDSGIVTRQSVFHSPAPSTREASDRFWSIFDITVRIGSTISGICTCAKTITTPLKGDAVYLLGQKKGGSVLTGGAKMFCTTIAVFDIRGAGNCAGRGFSEQGFAMTPTKGVAGYVAHIGAAGLVNQSQKDIVIPAKAGIH